MFAKIQRVHFVGIGGIGMSGIAEVLLLRTERRIFALARVRVSSLPSRLHWHSSRLLPQEMRTDPTLQVSCAGTPSPHPATCTRSFPATQSCALLRSASLRSNMSLWFFRSCRSLRTASTLLPDVPENSLPLHSALAGLFPLPPKHSLRVAFLAQYQ